MQSNVTTRIRTLEHELGPTLFERHANGVSCAPAGLGPLPYACPRAIAGRTPSGAR